MCFILCYFTTQFDKTESFNDLKIRSRQTDCFLFIIFTGQKAQQKSKNDFYLGAFKIVLAELL
jgi:hypothetical protein